MLIFNKKIEFYMRRLSIMTAFFLSVTDVIIFSLKNKHQLI